MSYWESINAHWMCASKRVEVVCWILSGEKRRLSRKCLNVCACVVMLQFRVFVYVFLFLVRGVVSITSVRQQFNVFCDHVTWWHWCRTHEWPWSACERRYWVDFVDCWPRSSGSSTAAREGLLVHVLWWFHRAYSNWWWHPINTFVWVQCDWTCRRRFVESTIAKRFVPMDTDWTLAHSRHVPMHIPPNANRLPAALDGKLCWFDLDSTAI